MELANDGDPYFSVRVGNGGAHNMLSITEQRQTTVRRLTELECERLQGYPDGWTDGQTGSARYRQLGNSVAVPVVEWIAHRLVNTHNHLEGDQ